MPANADILFVTRKWAPAIGGMETYSLRLSQCLSELAPVEVVALPGRADGRPPSAAALLGFPFKVAARWLRRKRPQVLHLGDMAIWPLGLLAKLSGRRTCIVLSAHGTDVAYHRRGGIKGRLYGAYLKLGARLLRGATVIANSRATARVAAETGWTRSEVVPLATDVSGSAPDGSHDGALLFVGRLVERKGCGWFVREVLPLLPATIRLKVAGTGWHESEQAALSDPRVEWLGPLRGAALVEAYASALAVVVPNIDLPNGEYEGFGLVAPEGAAAGGLVLAAASGGLVDAVIDGETGFLVPSGDAQAWAAKIIEVTGWPAEQRHNFACRAMAQARVHYSWRRVARETLAVSFGKTATQERNALDQQEATRA
jgi:glycosyltransferase involved in cell wall biosynthesis